MLQLKKYGDITKVLHTVAAEKLVPNEGEVFFLTQSNGQQLELIRQLVEEEKIQPVIDKIYPLEKYREAFAYLKTNRAKGKIVLNQI